jgi:hypothetical protein
MKASGLIGLIVVILFFMVHTFLGALAPKKPAQGGAVTGQDPGAGPGPAAPAAPGAVAATPGGSEAVTTDSAFPISSVPAAKPGSIASSLEREIKDPFVPRRKENQSRFAGGNGRPDNVIDADGPRFNGVGAVDPPLSPSNRGFLPPAAGFSPAGPGGSIAPISVTPPPMEPEIKVVGLVDGDPPIATLTVSGRSVLAHRGDPLAKGYRVLDISPNGVVIRCGPESKSLRVGGVINERSDARAEAR